MFEIGLFASEKPWQTYTFLFFSEEKDKKFVFCNADIAKCSIFAEENTKNKSYTNTYSLWT